MRDSRVLDLGWRGRHPGLLLWLRLRLSGRHELLRLPLLLRLLLRRGLRRLRLAEEHGRGCCLLLRRRRLLLRGRVRIRRLRALRLRRSREEKGRLLSRLLPVLSRLSLSLLRAASVRRTRVGRLAGSERALAGRSARLLSS